MTDPKIVRDPIIIETLMKDAIDYLASLPKHPDVVDPDTAFGIAHTVNAADLAGDLAHNPIFTAIDVAPSVIHSTCTKVVMSLFAQKLIKMVASISSADQLGFFGSPLWVEVISPEKAKEIKGKISILTVMQYLVENPDEKHRENGYTIKELSDILFISTPSIYARAKELDEDDAFIKLVPGENVAMSRVVRIPDAQVSAKKIS